MTEDHRSYFLQHYRSMATEELIELRPGDLPEDAIAALNQVITERGVSPEQRREITEQITEERRATKKPYGVRGWLALLVVGMMFLGPLMGAGSINSYIMMTEYKSPQITSLAEWILFKRVTWWAFLVVVAIDFYGGLGLARGRDWSVVNRAIQILWVTGPLASILMFVIIPFFVFRKAGVGGIIPASGWTAYLAEYTGPFIVSLIAAGVWTAYLSKSKRVRNTYSDRCPQT